MNRSETDSLEVSPIDEAFLRRMLHELSAPARHVRFFASQLDESLGPLAKRGEVPGDTMESIDVLKRAGTSMEILLDQLRVLITETSVKSQSQPTEIGQVVQSAWNEAVKQHPGLEAKLEYDGESTTNVDEGTWMTILQCLFDNCLRNARDGARLKVTVLATDQRVTVADNGTGIDAKAWDRALCPFERLKSTPITRPGLGLTIVNEVAMRHGCELRLIDPGEASTCIAIELPKQPKID